MAGRTEHPRERGLLDAQYLYERLEEKPFQRLVSALLLHMFPKVEAYPVGQKDGGRDAVQTVASGSIVYQVKWTKDALQDPVSWLKAAVRGEKKNIKELVLRGATRYILVTSVAGTSERDRGTMDKLKKALRTFEDELGIEVEVWWRANVDAAVAGAPDSLKWTFGDMLAGWDLVRYMIAADRLSRQDEALRALLRKFMATQWAEDARIKFKQAELEKTSVVDLFVDVEAEHTPRSGKPFAKEKPSVGGAANYLLKPGRHLTVVRGAPGQGKSTLGQVICQAHRAEFLYQDQSHPGRPEQRAAEPRVAIRIDLQDYASWMSGEDPFSNGERPDTITHLSGDGVEPFVAHLITVKSGRATVLPDIVHDIVDRFPVLFLFDGLDEVANIATRQRVVENIETFGTRATTNLHGIAPQIVVTTRPSNGAMPEPWDEQVEVLSLSGLSRDLRIQYLRKWADLREIRGSERRALTRTFTSRSTEPYIAQLSENPMQLSILLYLISKRGNSVPTSRADLYRSYMDTFLDREGEKAPAVAEHREDLEEVTAFLGWHLQSLAESDDANGKLTVKELKRLILTYLFDRGRSVAIVDDLFTAITDRVWALASKESGTFQFDVQPIREYFAARYLREYAGAGDSEFDDAVVLSELVRRSYWLNTARFYAGLASTNELLGMVETFDNEFRLTSSCTQVRLALWAFLVDGIFTKRPKTQARAARLFSDPFSIRMMPTARKAAQLPTLDAARGGADLVEHLKSLIESDPSQHLALPMVELCIDILPNRALTPWWTAKLTEAAGTAEEGAWLTMAVPIHAGARMSADAIETLKVDGPEAAQCAVSSGAYPRAGGLLERKLLDHVLAGDCSQTVASGSRPSDLATLMSPRHFLRLAGDEFYASEFSPTAPPPVRHTPTRRQAVGGRLTSLDARYEQVVLAGKFKKGQSGTTSPWVDSARLIAQINGANWLSAEVALIGAATSPSRFRSGGGLTRDSEILGKRADYGRLVEQVRHHRGSSGWWAKTASTYDDELSWMTWSLALLGVADEQTVIDSLDQLNAVTSELGSSQTRALGLASARLGAANVGRRLNNLTPSILNRATRTTAPMLLHHVRPGSDVLRRLPLDQLQTLAQNGFIGWPAHLELYQRAKSKPTVPLMKILTSLEGLATPASPFARPPAPERDALEVVIEGAALAPLHLLIAWGTVVEHDLPVSDVARSRSWFAE